MKDYKEAIENIMADTTNKVINHAISAYNKGYADGFGKAQTDSYVKGYEDGKADTPFTDTEEAEKKAYQRGFEDGQKEKPQVIYEMKVEEYNKGLNEAWEVARKIEHPKGYFCNIKEVFGEESAFSVLLNMTASEAIAKIKAYEDKQEQFAVGDEVYSDAFDNKGIITHITADKVSCVCIICNGSTMMKVGTNGLHKTGRHFDAIPEVLKQMNREEDK